MPTIAALQAELAEAQDNLDTCIETIKLGMEDEETLAMKAQFEEEVASLNAQIASKKAAASDVPPPPPPSGDHAPKYDMSKHPKFRTASPDPAAAREPADVAKTDFKVGDSVMAKYSADKQWYPASVVSKTGSSADPVYTVSFTGYSEKENKRKFEVRAMENKKRKAEAPPEVPAPPPPSSPVRNGNVISAAASIDTTLVQKREPSKVSDGPTRMAPAPKKLKGTKQLEKSKSSWASWQSSGPKKTGAGASKKMGKESQFRTPDLPNAKVGFTGSGKPMSKDVQRTRFNYSTTDTPED